ncbi:MAG: D-alanyl-D-alanine carboxypeptidase family protein [Verrucomicrobiales bacterium]
MESSLAERAAALDAREAKLAEMEEAVEAKLSVLRRGPVPSVYAKRTIIVDVHSGEPLYEKNADELCAVASTQKLLTALLVIENCDLDEAITVEREDADVAPTRVGIKPGETYTRRQLLTSLLVRSGNDIAVCLARTTAGSVEAFVEMMNARAAQLGMANSHFKNPHGLTEEGQHSTARDMALLARVAYANPIIHEIVQIEEYDFKFNDGSVRELFNTNKVLKSYEPCNGMKTGYTVASGNCLVSSGQVGDREIIAVVLGSTSSWVWRDSEALLDWALKDV